jgi:hypothetical protein
MPVSPTQHPLKLRAATQDAASARMRAAGMRAPFAARQLQALVELSRYAAAA